MAAQENPLGSAQEPVTDVPPAQEAAPARVVRHPRPRSRNRVIILAVAALAVAAGASWLWHYFGGYESTDDAQVDVHLAPVSARISGYVINVNVADNQYVE